MNEPIERTQRIPFTCTLDCGSRCELLAELVDGRLMRLDTPGNREDTIERPRLIPCARGRAQRRQQTSIERVLTPLQRTGPRGSGVFAPVSWDAALERIAEELERACRHHGAESILLATGAGSISGRGLNGASAARRFFSYWDGVSTTEGTLSTYCIGMVARWMLGEQVPGDDRATLLDSRLIILWGMNPGELRMAPNTDRFIAQARDRGARVILIDPRYTDSGILADQWIPIRPGTDAALAAALAYVMEHEGLVDRTFLASHTTGYELYQHYVLGEDDDTPKTPAWAEAITGVPQETIVQLARDYATLKPAALLPGWGPQRALYGEQYARAMITLACMTGNVGVRGGGAASVGTRGNIVPIGSLPMGPCASRRALSSAAWAPPILEDTLDPPITLAYIVASNLINRSPNTRANARALERLDFVVVHEPFLTPTTRYADIVLPIVTDLERSELVVSWGHDSHLFASHQIQPPAGEAHTDYWISGQLAARLGLNEAYTEGRSEEEWLAYLLDKAPLDHAALARDGVLRLDGTPRVALAEFRADPATHPLKTASGRIEIASAQAAAVGLPLIPSYVPAEPESSVEATPLQMVTPHSKQRSNSCAFASPWIRDAVPHTVWLNPLDAQTRSIADGDTVEVTNVYGRVRVAARVTERIMPGVVCLYQGTWYTPDQDGVDEGGCANVLTSHRLSPSGGATMQTGWVEIRRDTR